MAKKRNYRGGTPQRTAGSAQSAKGAGGATATTTRSAVVKEPANGPTAKNGTSRVAESQSERIAAARARNAAARAAADRRRAMRGGWFGQRWPIFAAVVTVGLIIAIFFSIAHNASSGSAQNGDPVPASVLSKVTGVTQATFETVGKGTIANPFQIAQGNPPVNKTTDGKPIFLYVGAEYCPFCAAERWSMIVALSRFGTFKDLKLTQSSSTDVYPNTSTFTFHGSSYTSQFLAFQAVETETRTQQTLEKLTDAQQAIFARYDAPPYIDAQYAGSIPFLSVGNQYIEISAGFIPDQMQGLTWQEIADKLSDPNDSITKSIVANANYITAAICQVTNQTPSSVCSAAPIPTIVSALKAGK